MAQAKGKLSRKELKQPDQFQSKGEDFLQRLIDNRKRIALVGGVLLALLAVYSIVTAYMDSRNEALSQKFGEIIRLYEAQVAASPDQANPAGNPPTFASDELKYVTVSEQLQSFVDEHKGSGFAKAARFYLANCFFMLKRYEKARENYEIFLKDAGGGFDGLTFLAHANIAQTYDAEGNLDEALKVYQKIADGRNPVWKAEATYMIAQIKKRQGKNDEAITLLLGIQTQEGDSSIKAKADKLLTVLRGPEVPTEAHAVGEGG